MRFFPVESPDRCFIGLLSEHMAAMRLAPTHPPATRESVVRRKKQTPITHHRTKVLFDNRDELYRLQEVALSQRPEVFVQKVFHLQVRC